jgi:hypothetical protein
MANNRVVPCMILGEKHKKSLSVQVVSRKISSQTNISSTSEYLYMVYAFRKAYIPINPVGIPSATQAILRFFVIYIKYIASCYWGEWSFIKWFASLLLHCCCSLLFTCYQDTFYSSKSPLWASHGVVFRQCSRNKPATALGDTSTEKN